MNPVLKCVIWNSPQQESESLYRDGEQWQQRWAVMSKSPPLHVWSSAKHSSVLNWTKQIIPISKQNHFCYWLPVWFWHKPSCVSSASSLKRQKSFHSVKPWDIGQNLDRSARAAYLPCKQWPPSPQRCCILAWIHCLLPSPTLIVSVQPLLIYSLGSCSSSCMVSASNPVILTEEAILFPKRHLAIPGDIVGCQDWWDTTSI